MQVFRTESKGNRYRERAVKYNSAGYEETYISYSRKGRDQFAQESKFDGKNRLTEVETSRNGKHTGTTTYEYDTDGKLLKNIGLDGKGIHSYSTLYVPDEKGKTKEVTSYQGPKKKIVWRYVNEYDDQGRKTKESRYNGKGKLVSVVKFDCELQGQLAKEEKKQCEKISVNDAGMKVKTAEVLDAKGRMMRMIVTYDSADRPADFRKYNYRGKIMNHWRSEYDANNLQLERWNYKPKSDELQAHYVYQRKANGLMELYCKYDGKEELKYKLEYEYERRE